MRIKTQKNKTLLSKGKEHFILFLCRFYFLLPLSSIHYYCRALYNQGVDYKKWMSCGNRTQKIFSKDIERAHRFKKYVRFLIRFFMWKKQVFFPFFLRDTICIMMRCGVMKPRHNRSCRLLNEIKNCTQFSFSSLMSSPRSGIHHAAPLLLTAFSLQVPRGNFLALVPGPCEEVF